LAVFGRHRRPVNGLLWKAPRSIDPTTNYLYSHSYIFNFGIPFVHTGIMSVSHVDPLVDIMPASTPA
jgi:hypothetical protein